MLYRIVADHRRIGDVIGLVNQRFNNFTSVKGASYNKGKKEYCVSIDIFCSTDEKIEVCRLAHRIQGLTAQPVKVYEVTTNTLTPLAPEPPKAKEKETAVVSNTIENKEQTSESLPDNGEPEAGFPGDL